MLRNDFKFFKFFFKFKYHHLISVPRRESSVAFWGLPEERGDSLISGCVTRDGRCAVVKVESGLRRVLRGRLERRAERAVERRLAALPRRLRYARSRESVQYLYHYSINKRESMVRADRSSEALSKYCTCRGVKQNLIR